MLTMLSRLKIIRRAPPEMWRGQIVKEERWVVRIPRRPSSSTLHYVVGIAILLSIAFRFFKYLT